MFRSTLSTALPTALALAVLAASGCSELNTEDDDTASGSGAGGDATLAGKAADGYLAGARVCLDLNSNNACDDGEPSTTTSAGGSYTLENVTQEQIDNSPIVVEIIVGETIDEDEPGVAIEKTYTLTAPAGSAFVSPLTTMVQNEIKENGLSPEAAKASIQSKLGTEIDPTADYVAGSDDETNGEEFRRLHKVAQVTRAVIQQNIELVDAVLEDSGVSMEDLTALIVEQVLNAMDDIRTAIDNAGDNFNADGVAGSEDLNGARLDPTTVEDDLQAREDRKAATAANLGSLVSTGEGLNFFEGYEDFDGMMYGYGNVKADSEGTINVTFFGYNPESETWVTESDDGDTEQECILTDGSWQCVADNDEVISVSGDNIRILRGGLSNAEEIIAGSEVSLTGKRISTYLRHAYHPVIDPAAVFEGDAKGYQLTITRTNDIYSIWKDSVASVSECWNGDFNEGNTWAPTDVWCNNVFVHTGDGNWETDGDAATALSQLVSASAASNPTSRADVGGVNIYGDEREWTVELVTGGTANIYTAGYNSTGTAEEIRKIASTTWAQTTVGGKEILTVNLPADIAFQGGYDEGRKPIFTVIDGYVRQGDMIPAGTSRDRQWVFNGAGRDQIKAAFDYSLLEPLAGCELEEQSEATLGDFTSAASACSATAFVNADVAGKAFFVGDGAFNFTADGNGLFKGEIGDGVYGSLPFTWELNGSSGHIVMNAQTTFEGTTVYMRMTLAKVAINARQISLVTFAQEDTDSSTLPDSSGEVRADVWGIR